MGHTQGGSRIPVGISLALPLDAKDAGFCLLEALQCPSAAKLPASPAWPWLWGWVGALAPQGRGSGASRALTPWHGQGLRAERPAAGAVGSFALQSRGAEAGGSTKHPSFVGSEGREGSPCCQRAIYSFFLKKNTTFFPLQCKQPFPRMNTRLSARQRGWRWPGLSQGPGEVSPVPVGSRATTP